MLRLIFLLYIEIICLILVYMINIFIYNLIFWLYLSVLNFIIRIIDILSWVLI